MPVNFITYFEELLCQL